MEIQKYKVGKNNNWNLHGCSTIVTNLPSTLIIRQPFKDECQHLVRSPEQCIFSIYSKFISPMYVGDLDMPYIRWGYTEGYALIFKEFEENLDIISFEYSANVAHSIFYDYLNGRFTDTISQLEKSILLLNSNM